MLRQTVKYTDFNGEPAEKVCYFNLTRTEALTLEMSLKGGLAGRVREITANHDILGMYDLFKELVLLSYGEKSADGARFIKSAEIRAAFEQSPEFDEFLIGLITDESGYKAVNFIKGILPKEFRDQADSPEALEAAKAELDKLTEDGVY